MTPFLLATVQPPESTLDPLVVIILTLLVVGIGVIFIIYTRARVAQSNQDRGTAREQIDAVKHRAASTDATDRTMSDMLETTRRLASQLDNKAARLEQLLEQADQRIESLDGLASRAPATNGGARPGRPDERHYHGTPDDDDETPSLESERLEHLSREHGRPREELTTEIHRLADQGFSPVEIAQRLDEHTGKVELVLALRARQD